MAITLNSILPRTTANTIDMNTPYSDINTKSSRITEDMVIHLETQIAKAETDFNTNVQADITAVTNAKDVAVTAASNANSSEINALSYKDAASASATASYNSSVTAGTSASEALISANNAKTSETNASVSESNALASASTATSASLTAVAAKDTTVTLANQVSVDTATTVSAKDTAVASATTATNAASSAVTSADTSNVDAVRAELAAQNAEQSALIATSFQGYVGVWDPTITYNTGDIVSFGRLIYACNLNGVVGISPTHIQNTTEWFFLGRDHYKYLVINANYLAEDKDYLFIDTVQDLTIALPLVHTINDTIVVYSGESSESHNVIVDGNGSLLKRIGVSDTFLQIDVNGREIKFLSNGTDWRVI